MRLEETQITEVTSRLLFQANLTEGSSVTVDLGCKLLLDPSLCYSILCEANATRMSDASVAQLAEAFAGTVQWEVIRFEN